MMIEYIRRYLSDPESVPSYASTGAVVDNSTPNTISTYLRRYLADPINIE